jgi:hypothetical protein
MDQKEGIQEKDEEDDKKPVLFGKNNNSVDKTKTNENQKLNLLA